MRRAYCNCKYINSAAVPAVEDRIPDIARAAQTACCQYELRARNRTKSLPFFWHRDNSTVSLFKSVKRSLCVSQSDHE